MGTQNNPSVRWFFYEYTDHMFRMKDKSKRYSISRLKWPLKNRHKDLKGDSNPNDKDVLSVRTLWTMNFDTSVIKIGSTMEKLWAFKEFNMANI